MRCRPSQNGSLKRKQAAEQSKGAPADEQDASDAEAPAEAAPADDTPVAEEQAPAETPNA